MLRRELVEDSATVFGGTSSRVGRFFWLARETTIAAADVLASRVRGERAWRVEFVQRALRPVHRRLRRLRV
jgi:hypothetical protein